MCFPSIYKIEKHYRFGTAIWRILQIFLKNCFNSHK